MNIIKRIKYLLLLLFVFCPLSVVHANEIYSIDMKVDINKSGDASIRETWKVKGSDGSEWYKQYKNLKKTKIKDFKVSMDGEPLKEKRWKVNESLEQKRGYYGVHRIRNGIELCFGKYDMNEHTFTLTYTMTNVIFNTNDSQVLYLTLLPRTNVRIDKFNIDISSFYSYPDDLNVWGYGYLGYVYAKDGHIRLYSDEASTHYVVVLAKFPLNTYDTDIKYRKYKSFDDVYNMSLSPEKEVDIPKIVLKVLLIASSSVIAFAFFGYLLYEFYKFVKDAIVHNRIFLTSHEKESGYTLQHDNYAYFDNRILTTSNVPIVRDLPTNKSVLYNVTLLDINGFKYRDVDLFGAILASWIKDGIISYGKDEKIYLNVNSSFERDFEKQIFDNLRAASHDDVLEKSELRSWCQQNFYKFLSSIGTIPFEETKLLKEQGHITETHNHGIELLDESIYNDSLKLIGLKAFLINFSKMEEKEVLEIKLWDEYLVFAVLFGLANKVKKKLKEFYPDLVNPNMFNFLDTLSDFSSAVNTSEYARTVHDRSTASSSNDHGSFSDGGGGSSSSGGGGSIGGGGSMGSR